MYKRQVVYDLYDTNEIMYTKLKTGGANYDVIIPSDYMIGKLVEEDMLAPLNFDNIPNYQYIDEQFKNRNYDPDNLYSVPYTWGTVGIIYNTKYVTEPVDSWSLLWDEAYKGKILMFDNSRDAFAISQLLLGQDVNTTSTADLDAASQKLAEQKDLVQDYIMVVSYTHLDVYKRQPPAGSSSAGQSLCPEWGRLETNAVFMKTARLSARKERSYERNHSE